MNKVRLFPLLALAALSLLALKSLGLFFSGSYVLTGQAPAAAQEAPPSAKSAKSGESGESGEEPEAPKAETGSTEPDKEAAAAPAAIPDGSYNLPQHKNLRSKSEESLLQNLAKRREKLDAKFKELKLRENLLKAAEKQLADRVKKLKELEKKLSKSADEQQQEAEADVRRLVKMYSSMKPVSAARIFNRLDIKILKDLVRKMKTRKMAPILAAMDPARAELLTLEIAKKENSESEQFADLPKVPSN